MSIDKTQFEYFPEIKQRYLKAFEEMVKIRKEKGLLYNGKYQTAQEWFDWWISK